MTSNILELKRANQQNFEQTNKRIKGHHINQRTKMVAYILPVICALFLKMKDVIFLVEILHFIYFTINSVVKKMPTTRLERWIGMRKKIYFIRKCLPTTERVMLQGRRTKLDNRCLPNLSPQKVLSWVAPSHSSNYGRQYFKRQGHSLMISDAIWSYIERWMPS